MPCDALSLYWLKAVGFDLHGTHISLLSLAFFAMMTMSFKPLCCHVVQSVDRLTFRDRCDYALILQCIGSELASSRPLSEVLAGVTDTLAGAMHLHGAAVLLRQPGGELTLSAASGDLRHLAQETALLARARCWWSEGCVAPAADRWLLLVAHDQEQGLLYLCAKRSGAAFSAGDCRLVETLSSQVAVTIANALLVERLETKVTELALLSDRLLRVQEEERRLIAQDLHDGPLQTVLALLRQVEATVVALSVPCYTLPGLDVHLHRVIERGLDAVHELRTACADLYPPELRHIGIAAALTQLAQDISRDEQLIVRFLTTSMIEDQSLPTILEEAIYRIAHEALLNVLRHARAHHADIHLEWTADSVALTVHDDGCGFSAPMSIPALLRTGHLGLAGIRVRSERLGGDCSVVGWPGGGTTVHVRFPKIYPCPEDN